MYKNIFAACLVLSIGFHAAIAAFVISHKPSDKHNFPALVQQVSLVERLRFGTDAIKKTKAVKNIWKNQDLKESEVLAGPENVQTRNNSSDKEKALDAKAENPSEISRTEETSSKLTSQAGDISESGTAESGTKDEKGEDEYAFAGGAPGGTRSGITKARMLKAPDIRYDETSRRRGEEGSVSIDLVIDKSGNPRNVRIKQSSGYPRLDRVAMNGIRSMRFSPTKKSGRPVNSEVEYTIIFRLDGMRNGLKVVEDDKVNILE